MADTFAEFAAVPGAPAKRQRTGASADVSVRAEGTSSASGPPRPSSCPAEPSTAAPAGGRRIATMGTGVVQRICSDQVIVDLPSALKELLENALDAGATRIDVRLKEHGVALLEVLDNGRGVPAPDLSGIALRHHTSKLREFDDLQRLQSFGFRGEALNSLAALASLSVSTRTDDDPTGTRLTFGKDGAVASRAPVARETGTCVTVEDLFASFPVRRRELQRNA
jgi:DNA mismatch repair protein PMS2